MASIATAPRPAAARAVGAPPLLGPRVLAVAAAIGAAWFIALAAQLTGRAMLLHHHTLIEGGPPLWLALPIFLVAWQVMIAAMMLPASLPAVRAFDVGAARRASPELAMAAFLGAYALVWTGYGVGAFMFDVGLHRFVDATPWLGARPWLIEGSAIVAAATYQFLPIKRRSLAACRHPAAGAARAGGPRQSVALAARIGFGHAVDCVVSSWALMLLMFAAGFANLWWMAGLAAAMGCETMGRHGRRSASVIGVALLALGAVVLATGWTPAFVAD